MNFAVNAWREIRLLARDRGFLVWVVLAWLLATLAVSGGVSEVARQRATLARLLTADEVDRQDAFKQQTDWGGAAYSGFHLTYNPPSNFTFAALGMRDRAPWKHRVRMLALEGQIYERDAGNPVLALVGRFDFAFFAAYVVPLLLIVVLYDLQTSERAAGRHALLVSTAREAMGLWRLRALLRVGSLALVTALPLLLGCIVSSTAPGTAAMAVALLLAYCVVWGLLIYWVAGRQRSSEEILSILLGLWLLLGIVGPALGKLAIDLAVPTGEGSDILMVQREAVNAAWDLPKEVTMEAFVARHPEWADYAAVEQPFHWKWYFAFQQVGDQRAESLANAYREGRYARDKWAARVAWLAPPALLERAFDRLAGSDLRAQLAYEGRIRAFHAELRHFYYDKLFRDQPYAVTALGDVPEFRSPAQSAEH